MLQDTHVLTITVIRVLYHQDWKHAFTTSCMCTQQLLVPPSLPNLGMQSVQFWAHFHLLIHNYVYTQLCTLYCMGKSTIVAKRKIHSPNLDTVQMIERTIEPRHDFRTVTELYNALPRGVQHATFKKDFGVSGRIEQNSICPFLLYLRTVQYSGYLQKTSQG